MSDKYEYSFCVWPSSTWGFPKGIYEVFECLKGRIVFGWTKEQFEKVRSELSHIGLEMHEIGCRPYVEEEIIL